MAFQPAQRHQPRPRSYSATAPEAPITTAAAPAAPQPQQRQSPRQSPHDWIVFSPAAPSESYDFTDSTIRTDRIAGEVSDFGSLDTAAVSEKHRHTNAHEDSDQQHQQKYDDDKENRETEAEREDVDDADSLDDGLHAFNEPSIGSDQRMLINQSGDTVLPTHDGLGMFPGSSSPVQEQFWQHEKYNPRRQRQSLRRSSLQKRFDTLEEQVEQLTEEEKVQRIENWRMEQSQAILEEIERETRRRRRRKSRASASKAHRNSSSSSQPPPSSQATTTSRPRSTPIQPSSQDRLSFWERLTRSVIRNLIGIDEATLEYLFGESLPTEPTQSTETPSLASELIDHAERTIPNDGLLAASTESWEQRLLARISKELGILLGHISEHPGAFTSYLRTKEPPAYAGLSSSLTLDKSTNDPSSSISTATKASTNNTKFGPTLATRQHHHTHRQSITTTDPSLWGIEEEDEDKPNAEPSQPTLFSDEAARLQHERDYWERDLDVKMVFGFLRDRFTSSPNESPQLGPQQQQHEARQYAQPRSLSRPNATSLQLNTATTAANIQSHSARNADSLRRAALIRHHHPLVSRNIAASQNSQNQSRSRGISSATPLSPILGRRPSCAAETESYASQSTKRSKTAHSSSSRNFWDIGGGSLGAASVSWGLV